MTVLALTPKVKKTVSQAVADAFKHFEKTIGGRGQLVATLSLAELTPDIEAVLCAIGDPLCDSTPLADICYAHNLQPGQVIAAYHAAQAKAVQVLAFHAIASAVPAVVAEISRLALPHDELCSACHGVGKIARAKKRPGRGRNPQPIICVTCEGSGKRKVDGDGDQQDRVLDLAKLVTKGGGINLGVVTNVNPSSQQTGSLDLIQQAAASILATRPPLRAASAPDAAASASVVDATVIEEPDAALRLDH